MTNNNSADDELELMDESSVQEKIKEHKSHKEKTQQSWKHERQTYAEVAGYTRSHPIKRLIHLVFKILFTVILAFLLYDAFYIFTGIGVHMLQDETSNMLDQITTLEAAIQEQEHQMDGIDFAQLRANENSAIYATRHKEYEDLATALKNNQEQLDELNLQYDNNTLQHSSWRKRIKVRLRFYFSLIGLYDKT